MNGLVLVAGATGYVGGRLWRRLEADGRRVRCLGRRQAGVQRIIYLGDLWYGEVLSPYLRSRHEVGEALRESGVPVIEMHQQSRGQS
jgi:uncharacterized protein YbjT (DUF2867 family)